MINRTLLKLVLIANTYFSFAQGVIVSGNDNDIAVESAIFEVRSEDKGLLLPRVALTGVNDLLTVPNPVNGLFVFSENGNVPDGFYFWNTTESKWVCIVTTNQINNFGSGNIITDAERTKWNSIIGIPVGTIIPFAGPTIPDGWLSCDGLAISRTQYNTLFAVIGTVWGVGDGATTFNLPDLRGRFARGVDADAGNDLDADTRFAPYGGNTGNMVGSYQKDTLENHNHIIYQSNYNGWGYVAPTTTGTSVRDYPTTYTGGSETRPKNAYVNYIIKY